MTSILVTTHKFYPVIFIAITLMFASSACIFWVLTRGNKSQMPKKTRS